MPGSDMTLWKQESPPKLRSNLRGEDVNTLLHKTLDDYPEIFRKKSGRAKDFSEKFNINYSTAYRILKGHKKLDLDLAAVISDTLKVDLNCLISSPSEFGGKSNKHNNQLYLITKNNPFMVVNDEGVHLFTDNLKEDTELLKDIVIDVKVNDNISVKIDIKINHAPEVNHSIVPCVN